MIRPTYPDDFGNVPMLHLSDERIDAMVDDVMWKGEAKYVYSGDTLVLNSAGQILVFALITQAPAVKP